MRPVIDKDPDGQVTGFAKWPRAMIMTHALALGSVRDLSGASSERAVANIGASLSADEWDRVHRLLVERHRIAPLVAGQGALAPAPAALRTALANGALANSMDALRQIGETMRIVDALGAIEPVVLKGWPLAERFYGTAGLRHARDLDLLVKPEQIAETVAVLEDLGYRLDGMAPSLVGHAAILSEEKDMLFVHEETNLLIELHWGLYHFRHWPDPMTLPGAIMRHEGPSDGVACLSDRANLVFLSIHGALHVWARMKWLVDIALLAHRRGAELLDEDLEAARRIGAGPATALALRLASRLFESPLPASLAATAPEQAGLEAVVLEAMGRDGTAPHSLHNRFWSRVMPVRLSGSLPQAAGVLRYDTVRRVRLGLAQVLAYARGN